MGRRMAYVAALLCAAGARADERFGVRGQVVPFGGIGFSHNSSNGTSTDFLGISPGALWFFADGVAVGGLASLGWQSGSQVNGLAGSPSATTSAGLAPELAATVALADRLVLFPQLTARFSWAWSGGSTFHGITLQAFAPIAFVPVPHLFIGFGPYFGWVVDASGGGAGATSLGM